eukprot:TRINITY_DN4504_c0_g1_i1.p1 TRINITY_DN4504_c0_g1~~TRINITY_DN4504_c0_g1_i1.p1  ORF type:complete len:336 (-),score=34.63 TRINITY_DN4504_c0_g1_i1:346-1245(-)
MNSIIVILLAFLPTALQQVVLEVGASGALGDGSSASGQGSAIGSDTQGSVEVLVDKTTSKSSVVLSATGSGHPVVPKVYVPHSSKPVQKRLPVPIHKKGYVKPTPQCEDIKDDKCYNIHQYEKCGYCILAKYPTKGYGCSYTEEVILKKKGESKKEYVYETKITPMCHCDGIYITEKDACPSCDSLLKEILTCAGSKTKTGEIKIPAKCLKTVGVSEKQLVKCGLLPILSKKGKEEPKPTYIVVQKEDPKVIVETQPVHVGASASASASASAFVSGSASGKGSTAIATATASAASTKGH